MATKTAQEEADHFAFESELLSIAKRWLALDASAWHPTRHAAEKFELEHDTLAVITKADGARK